MKTTAFMADLILYRMAIINRLDVSNSLSIKNTKGLLIEKGKLRGACPSSELKRGRG